MTSHKSWTNVLFRFIQALGFMTAKNSERISRS